jgi:hypothetical protein
VPKALSLTTNNLENPTQKHNYRFRNTTAKNSTAIPSLPLPGRQREAQNQRQRYFFLPFFFLQLVPITGLVS